MFYRHARGIDADLEVSTLRAPAWCRSPSARGLSRCRPQNHVQGGDGRSDYQYTNLSRAGGAQCRRRHVHVRADRHDEPERRRVVRQGRDHQHHRRARTRRTTASSATTPSSRRQSLRPARCGHQCSRSCRPVRPVQQGLDVADEPAHGLHHRCEACGHRSRRQVRRIHLELGRVLPVRQDRARAVRCRRAPPQLRI